MKIIQYQLCSRLNHGTEEKPGYEEILTPIEIRCKNQLEYDANYSVAQREAVPGTIAVTGAFEQDETPSQLDVIEAQLTYTAMMTDTLLEV